MDPRPSRTVFPLDENLFQKYCSDAFLKNVATKHGPYPLVGAPVHPGSGILRFFPKPDDDEWEAFASKFVPPPGLEFDGTYENFVGIILYAIVSCVPQAKAKLKTESQNVSETIRHLSSRSLMCKTEFEQGSLKSFEDVFTAVFLGRIGPIIGFMTVFLLEAFSFKRPRGQGKFSLNPESVSCAFVILTN